MKSAVTAARQAFELVQTRLSPASCQLIAQRLARWETIVRHEARPVVSWPELVVRVGLPPRPLNVHYFTVVRAYD